MFFYSNGTAAPVIDADDIHLGLTGVAMMSTNKGIQFMEEVVAQGGQLARMPLAIIIPNTNKEALDRLDALPILHKFRPIPITELPMTISETQQDTRRPDAIMFQLGNDAIS